MTNSWRGKSNPYRLVVTSSKRCNAKCSFCRVWGATDRSRDTTVSVVTKVLDEVGTITHCRIGGFGEPLLNRDLPHIVDEISGRKKTIGLITNGMLLKSWGHKVDWRKFRNVLVSLNAANAKEYKERLGVDKFDEVCKGIRLVASTGVKVACVFVIERSNIERMPYYASITKKLGVHHCFFSPFSGEITKDGGNFKSRTLLASDPEVRARLQVQIEMLPHYGHTYKFPYVLNLEKPVKQCKAPIVRIDVDGDGNVGFCGGSEGPKASLGNIHKTGVQAAYFGGELEKLRLAAIGPTSGRPYFCSTCRFNYSEESP